MSVFTRDGDLLVPTGHARGPWDPGSMHGGAPAAVAARAIEQASPNMRIVRLTVEFIGAVPMLPLTVEATVVKPGKRFQIAEATIHADGREVAWVRANLLRTEDTQGVPKTDIAPLGPAPDTIERHRYKSEDVEEFGITAMDLRFVESSFAERGPAKVWFRLDMPLVEGEEPSPTQLAVAAGDFGNGVSNVLDWNEWIFVNTELTIHLGREPQGGWVGLDAVTVLEENGSGLAVSTLHDQSGPIGRAAQALFVTPRGR